MIRNPVIYKLMIVDDEAAIREGMMRYDWGRWGFEATASAPNGRRALQELERSPVDLIITDIRMPGMDGLALCREIRERYPDCVVIILSGHQDFEYAQSAIKAGVLDYLLKPVDMERSAEIFMRAKAELDRRAKQRDFIEHAAPIALETLVGNILLGQVRMNADILRTLDVLSVSLEAPGYSVTCLSLSEDRERNVPALQKKLLETARSFFHCFVVSVQHTFFVLNLTRAPGTKGQHQQLLTQAVALKKACTLLCSGEPVFVGIGEVFPSLAQVAKSRQQAALLVRKTQFAGDPRIYAQWHIQQMNAEYPVALERGLVEAILAGDEERAGRVASELMTALLLHYFALPDTSFVSLAIRFMRRVDQALEGHALSWKNVGVEADYSAFVGRYAHFRRLSEAIPAKARAMAALKTEAAPTAFRAIHQARQYILSHYDEKITLGDMAKRAYLNISYFSVMFKKVTGKNFIDYLTEVRMEQAKKLLAEPDVRIYAVGYQVGYPNPRYFSDSFRRHAGVSPQEYRAGLLAKKTKGIESMREGD